MCQRQTHTGLSDSIQDSQFSAGLHKLVWTLVSQETLPKWCRLVEHIIITVMNITWESEWHHQRCRLTRSKAFWVLVSYSWAAASTHCITASPSILCSLISRRYSSAFWLDFCEQKSGLRHKCRSILWFCFSVNVFIWMLFWPGTRGEPPAVEPQEPWRQS